MFSCYKVKKVKILVFYVKIGQKVDFWFCQVKIFQLLSEKKSKFVENLAFQVKFIL